MKAFRIVTLSLVLGVLSSFTLAQTEITYWQYDFGKRVEAITQLIEQFEAENPDIKVIQETFPYADYQAQVGASLPAGVGADVVQLFYGWVPTWVRAGYVTPLPSEYFDVAEIEAEFIPMAQAGKYQGEYYGLPTAVRSLALFYNKDLMAEAGIENPPTTWDEFIAAGKAMTIKRGSRFSQIGYGIAPTGQDHHLVREILTRQFGTAPYEDGQVLYGNEAGTQAFEFYTSWATEHEIGVPEFLPGNSAYREGFRQQQNIAMIIDGSFAIGAVKEQAEFEWGVTEIPVGDNGVKANFGSFWMNGITPNAHEDPAKLEASAKFLKFVTTPAAMKLWLDTVGELPARKEMISDPNLTDDPVFEPFIASLAYAEATPFVDESGQRAVIVDAMNRVLLEGADPAESWAQAVEEDQAIWDSFAE